VPPTLPQTVLGIAPEDRAALASSTHPAGAGGHHTRGGPDRANTSAYRGRGMWLAAIYRMVDLVGPHAAALFGGIEP